MINRLLHSRGSNSNRSFGPADVPTRPCGLPQTLTHPCGRPHRRPQRCPQTSQQTTGDLHTEILRTSAQKKFPACVDLRTKRSNTPQTSAGKCPQFSMRNITFFVDISGTGNLPFMQLLIISVENCINGTQKVSCSYYYSLHKLYCLRCVLKTGQLLDN